MGQIHRRFTVEQVKVLLQGYLRGTISRAEVQEMLEIGKTRFFALLKQYRESPAGFSIRYERRTPTRLGSAVEAEIKHQLAREKALIDDPRLPISGYNYSAVRDRLQVKGISVSITTVIRRARQLGCYKPPRTGKVHDRQVLTAAIGALVQHDASLHLWSPFAQDRWTLITSIDDYSRKLLFAEFFVHETAWAHIQAAQSLTQTYGLPLCYYVDNLRVFRFIQQRDSTWRRHVLQTDSVDTQWRQTLRVLGVDVTYAMSPQAKGKVERPYRWMQDRIVRTCALEHLASLEDVRAVLKYEVDRYNNHQVHSVTHEIPSVRFENTRAAGLTLFRPFVVPKPYKSTKDVFCLRETRQVNGYRRIKLFSHEIEVRGVPLYENVDLHLVPDPVKPVVEVRIWYAEKMVQSLSLPINDLPVHF